MAEIVRSLALRPSGSRVMIARMAPRRIVLVAFPDVQILDITGPGEVFSLADRAARRRGGSTRSSSSPPTRARSLRQVGCGSSPTAPSMSCRGPIDTLIVAGGLGAQAAARDHRLTDWLRLAARRSRRVTSVCTGAFLLARAGLLDGRRATTHWDACAALARHYPSIEVEPDPIFVRDGNVYTSAGVTAGIDLALALVEEDLGGTAALDGRPRPRALHPSPRRAGAVQRRTRRPGGAHDRGSASSRPGSPTILMTISACRRSPSALHEPAELRPGVRP